jgi:glyoxylase-like metal-dependent hydrolase (beta-lactamase superfamily II)
MSENRLAQAPGFYRRAVGDILVTSLNDGMLAESVAVLQGIDGDAAAALLVEAFLPPAPVISVNAFLLQTPQSCILVDAGCGNGMGPGGGRLAANLQAAGVAPADIDIVLLTHMHPDHVGGLLAPDGQPAFPRARIGVPQADAAVFLDASIAASAPEPARPVFAMARAVAAAYGDRFAPFSGQPELIPGVTAVAMPGHSPGHTGYRVASRGDSMLIWGDIVHVPAIQAPRPQVGMIFDADPALAERNRRDAMAAAAQSRELIAGMHLPFPGFAYVSTAGSGFALVPILWSPTAMPFGAGA